MQRPDTPESREPGESGESGDGDLLVRGARLRRERRARWLQQGEPSVARRLAQIGVLGWIIVLPALGGVFLGRWLDRTLGTGLLLTAPLLMLGVGVGCWGAWKWMQGE
jgi:ATP synthase protein I